MIDLEKLDNEHLLRLFQNYCYDIFSADNCIRNGAMDLTTRLKRIQETKNELEDEILRRMDGGRKE